MNGLYSKRGFLAATAVLAAMIAGIAVVIAEDQVAGTPQKEANQPKQVLSLDDVPEPEPIAEFAWKGLEWLVKAQHPDGGWGAGSHADQANRNPSKVQVDPATTAFVAGTMLRTGSDQSRERYKQALRKATIYLVETVEKYDKPGPRITDLSGTQIQAKLGPLVDTVMTTQFFARVLPQMTQDDPLRKRVDAALDKCLKKLQEAQQKDGSWNVGGGWAPVLQSSLAGNSLELAQVAGKKIDVKKLEGARDYQKGNFDKATGRVDASGGAGVALYALSGAQRANASEARAARELVDEAKKQGSLNADAEVTAENLEKAGVEAPKARKLAEAASSIQAANRQLKDESLLRGFGSNGGEEFLSFLLTSESLVIHGGQEWKDWNGKMHERMAKIQSPDGSWSGHHCITSPVFCTAAVVQCVTTDRDAATLIAIARNSAKAGERVADRGGK